MNWRAPTLAAAVVAVVATSAAVGVRGRSHAAGTDDGASVRADRSELVSLQPVTIVARRPSLSEILDIVLHERPTAAQLGASLRGGRAFPKGSAEEHVAGILRKYSSDESRVDRIAAAIVKEGRRRHVESSLLVGVLLTENPWLDPRAKSPVGAMGLMQVMPFHAGKWGCTSGDLFDIEANICHGVAILADNLSQSRSLPQALLSYNGCVRGTNTPGCHSYPSVVYAHARRTVADIPASSRPFAHGTRKTGFLRP